MKKILFFLALAASLTVQGGWVDSSGKAISDSESMRSAGNFAVQLVLTPDDKQFRKTWNSTKGTPTLSTASAVHLGSSIAAVIIFHGCTPKVAGACDVVSKFFLVSPDGTKTLAGGGPIWSEAPLQERQLQLGLASMVVGFDKTDPVGDYKVIADITDRNSGRTLNLVAKFKVTK